MRSANANNASFPPHNNQFQPSKSQQILYPTYTIINPHPNFHLSPLFHLSSKKTARLAIASKKSLLPCRYRSADRSDATKHMSQHHDLFICHHPSMHITCTKKIKYWLIKETSRIFWNLPTDQNKLGLIGTIQVNYDASTTHGRSDWKWKICLLTIADVDDKHTSNNKSSWKPPNNNNYLLPVHNNLFYAKSYHQLQKRRVPFKNTALQFSVIHSVVQQYSNTITANKYPAQQ